jgi:hypothetical protein
MVNFGVQFRSSGSWMMTMLGLSQGTLAHKEHVLKQNRGEKKNQMILIDASLRFLWGGVHARRQSIPVPATPFASAV